MDSWNEFIDNLRKRLPEVQLTPELRAVAERLVEGGSVSEISSETGWPAQMVKVYCYMLSRKSGSTWPYGPREGSPGAVIPFTNVEIETLINNELHELSEELRQKWCRYRVGFEDASINRSGVVECVFVVARSSSKVIFFDDVEEGFAIGSLMESRDVKPEGQFRKLAAAIAALPDT